MTYFDGIELANLRFDAAVQAKCDPKKGWKRSGNKCVRNKLGQGGITAKQALAGIGVTALGGAAIGGATYGLLSRGKKKEQPQGGVTEKDVENLRNLRKKAEQSERQLSPEQKKKEQKKRAEAFKLIDEMSDKPKPSRASERKTRKQPSARQKDLEKSAKLAEKLGVDEKQILRSQKDIDKFMME